MPTGFQAFITAAISVLIAWLAGSAAATAQDSQIYSQAPEVALSESPGKAAAPIAREKPVDSGLERGPSPSWIWGPDENRRYFLKTAFNGGSTAARLKATCDNQVTIYLNGKQVVSSDEWQEPVEADVERLIKPGRNELVAEVTNQGSAAGFILKLALKQPDGAVRYVISDASWTAAPRLDSRNAGHARVIAPLGQGPWGDAFNRPASLNAKRGVFEVPPGFRVERLFTVPRDELGSWVSLTVDRKGRLIVSDEGNHGLARITPAPLGRQGRDEG